MRYSLGASVAVFFLILVGVVVALFIGFLFADMLLQFIGFFGEVYREFVFRL